MNSANLLKRARKGGGMVKKQSLKAVNVAVKWQITLFEGAAWRYMAQMEGGNQGRGGGGGE